MMLVYFFNWNFYTFEAMIIIKILVSARLDTESESDIKDNFYLSYTCILPRKSKSFF